MKNLTITSQNILVALRRIKKQVFWLEVIIVKQKVTL